MVIKDNESAKIAATEMMQDEDMRGRVFEFGANGCIKLLSENKCNHPKKRYKFPISMPFNFKCALIDIMNDVRIEFNKAK